MIITNLKDAPLSNNPHNVKTSVVYRKEDALVVHLTLEAGESLKRHITPVDVFFYVIEGKPIIEVGEEKQAVDSDCIVESPAGIPHCIYNETDKRARVLVVKTPRPQKSTKIL